jgi:hypothetical protein
MSSVFDKKVYAFAAHQSQVFEWLPWIDGYAADVPLSSVDRLAWLSKRMAESINADFLKSLEKWYGKERAVQVKHAEVFEIFGYGVQPNANEIKRLFQMSGK